MPSQIYLEAEAKGGCTRTEQKKSQQRHLKMGVRQPQPKGMLAAIRSGKMQGTNSRLEPPEEGWPC